MEDPEVTEDQPQYDEDQNRTASTSPTTQLFGAVASCETAKNFAHGAAPYARTVPTQIGRCPFQLPGLNRLFLRFSRSHIPEKPGRTARIALHTMKNSSLLGAVLAALFTALCLGAQTSSPSIVGEWRAEAPLPNGVIQTFRFRDDGNFDLAMALAVEGTYHVAGNQLIETVTLPSVGITHTDTASFAINGDSLVVTEQAGTPPRLLRRSGTRPASSSIVGDWEFVVGDGVAAHYAFDANGAMHMHASVGDEQGKYVVKSDTVRLTNDKTFVLPATAQFAIADSVLTLTPPSGKAPRHFHKVAPQ